MSVTINVTDYPALCEALKRLPAGRRRTSRLVALAYVGALFEQMRVMQPLATTASPNLKMSDQNGGGGAALNLSPEELADLGSWSNA
jgi:hypothetical protein